MVKNQKKMILENYMKLIKKYPSLLKPDFKNVKHSVEHCIDTGTAPPVRCKVRPLLPGSPKAIAGKAAWDQMEELGIIEKVDANDPSYYSSPLHLQDKPDGTQRPCGDFRALNDQTHQDATQLPDLNHFASQIKKAKFFSTIDIAKAFHFIPIRATDQHKVCVATPWGLYKYKRMAFGLKNAPASFMKFISEVLYGLEDVYTYLDDILVFSNNREEHFKTVEKVFARLNSYGLSLALPKCHFESEEVEFLGYKINKNGITPLDYKLQPIKSFPKPNTQKALLRFLGMLNFYRKTLPNLNTRVKKGHQLKFYNHSTLLQQARSLEGNLINIGTKTSSRQPFPRPNSY